MHDWPWMDEKKPARKQTLMTVMFGDKFTLNKLCPKVEPSIYA